MIRVLQVIGVMDRAGAETMVMNLYRAMDRDRVQFDFLVHEERKGDYDAEIAHLGGRIYRIPRFTGLNEISYRHRVRALLAAHPEWRVVHGHIGSCAPIYLSEAKRLGSFTVAHSHAQSYERGLAGLAFSMVSHPVRRIADYFMACSMEAGISRFGDKIVKSEHFSVVPNGIDTMRYACDEFSHESAKAMYGLPGRPIVCHVGRFIPVKNHEFLLKVFSRVKSKMPDSVLLCAGRGELEEATKDLAVELGCADSVRFLGVVDDVPGLLRAADVFIFPSIKEGLPVSVVEAQASGMSVITSTGVPDLAIVSDRIQRMSLSDGVDAWAAACVEFLRRAMVSERNDACDQVCFHGFDIANTSARLALFYEGVARGQQVRY